MKPLRSALLASLFVASALFFMQPSRCAGDPAADGWRRTTQGWEQESDWIRSLPREEPPGARVHPMIIAALEALVAVGALLAFERQPRRESAAA